MRRHDKANLFGSVGVRLVICLSLLLTVTACAADKTTATASRMKKPFLVSPQIDKTDVTFNLAADNAKEVVIVGQWSGWQRQPMTRNDNGTWTFKVTVMPPGVWTYFFLVDGLEINDPLNPVVQTGLKPDASIVQIPADPPAPWDQQNIPHGVLHTHRYFSTALGREREVIVYTPPGYGANSQPLPVLYLAHGWGGNEHSWTVEGRANAIADAMIATGAAVPMIIVMPNAHALPVTSDKMRNYMPDNTDAFINELRQDVRPLIESNYHVRTDADSRAFAGLSMGGAEAFTLGLTHPDEYTWIAALSPSSVPMGKIKAGLDAPATVNAKLHLFWVPVGRGESPEENHKFVDKLTAAGLKPEFELVDGDHSWPTWRGDLVKLLPRLFR